jgi:ribosomal protein S18 acetylase RimI-like enzyme
MKSFHCRFEILGEEYNRAGFHCGEEALDRYFQTQATQDIRRRIANCFVAVEAETGQIAGYYTLSASSISVVNLPPEVTKRLPRYPTLPAVRIGRLAVDERFQRLGLGMSLLLNAADRTMHSAAAAFTLLVDAKNDSAAAFYRRHGFRPLLNQPLTLYLPLATARLALAPSGSGTAP